LKTLDAKGTLGQWEPGRLYAIIHESETDHLMISLRKRKEEEGEEEAKNNNVFLRFSSKTCESIIIQSYDSLVETFAHAYEINCV
jgi:hypothetical protein